MYGNIAAEFRTTPSYDIEFHSLFNILMPKRYYMYHEIYNLEILQSADICVLHGSEKKQRLFLYTVLTYRIL
jgi:hypothetical protein